MIAKTTARKTTHALVAVAAASTALLFGGATRAACTQQNGQSGERNGSPTAAAQKRVSLDVDGKDVKDVLLDLFRQAGVGDYTIADDVSGPITLRLSDRPFEDALTFVARAAQPPLTWNKTDGVYSVKRRTVPSRDEEGGIPSDPPVITASGERYEMLYPVYADTQNLLRALELLQPAGLTAAFAYPPTNGLLVRFGGNGPLVTGVLGGGGTPGLPGGNANGLGGATGGSGNGAPGNFGGPPPAGSPDFGGNAGNANGGGR